VRGADIGTGEDRRHAMMKVRGAAIAVAATVLISGCATTRYTDFGESMTMRPAQAVPVDKVLEQPKEFEGQRALVSGTVDSVCAAKGCWIRVAGAPGAETLFVKFMCPVEGRLIPMEAVGHRVFVEGVIHVREMSVDEARHCQEDAGASPEEVARVVTPRMVVSMGAPSARIAGLIHEEKETK
jgi:hypothetical protein